MKNIFPSSFLLGLLFLIASVLCVSAQDLTVEQLISRHRDSIGPKDKISAVKNQMVVSDSKFTLKGSAVVLNGKALILSEGAKSLWGMNFNSNDYPQDRFGFDGKDVRVGRPTPSASRSLLGEFLYNNRALLKDGLVGGTLTNGWTLLTDHRAKMSVEGKKKIDEKNTVVLSYAPRGGSDVTIKMYFDEKTYQHVRTEYTVVRSASQGATLDASASNSNTIYKMVEDFSDFVKAGDLTLPRTYKITYNQTGARPVANSILSNRDAQWTFTVTNVNFNQTLDAGAFNIDG